MMYGQRNPIRNNMFQAPADFARLDDLNRRTYYGREFAHSPANVSDRWLSANPPALSSAEAGFWA